jgi:hypothetical protein
MKDPSSWPLIVVMAARVVAAWACNMSGRRAAPRAGRATLLVPRTCHKQVAKRGSGGHCRTSEIASELLEYQTCVSALRARSSLTRRGSEVQILYRPLATAQVRPGFAGPDSRLGRASERCVHERATRNGASGHSGSWRPRRAALAAPLWRASMEPRRPVSAVVGYSRAVAGIGRPDRVRHLRAVLFWRSSVPTGGTEERQFAAGRREQARFCRGVLAPGTSSGMKVGGVGRAGGEGACAPCVHGAVRVGGGG